MVTVIGFILSNFS